MKLVEGPEPASGGGGASESDDDDSWKVMGPRNRGAVERRWAARRTPVADIFRGRTRLRLHRAPHHDVTDAVQPFFTLQLDIEVSPPRLPDSRLLLLSSVKTITVSKTYYIQTCDVTVLDYSIEHSV